MVPNRAPDILFTLLIPPYSKHPIHSPFFPFNPVRLRENFTKNFTVTYSLRPIDDMGSVYRRYPDMWKVSNGACMWHDYHDLAYASHALTVSQCLDAAPGCLLTIPHSVGIPNVNPQVFLEEEGMSGRYKLIAEKPSRPAGADFVAGLRARPEILNAAVCFCLSGVVNIFMLIILILSMFVL